MVNAEKLLTVGEVAERLRLKPVTIYRWIRDGHLPAQRLPNGTFRIKTEDADQLLTSVSEQ